MLEKFGGDDRIRCDSASIENLEATTGFEPVDEGFADLCLTTWPRRHKNDHAPDARGRVFTGADNGTRTRDPNLGKVVLYQLSHVRMRRKLFYESPSLGASPKPNKRQILYFGFFQGLGLSMVVTCRRSLIHYAASLFQSADYGSYARLAQGESTTLTR